MGPRRFAAASFGLWCMLCFSAAAQSNSPIPFLSEPLVPAAVAPGSQGFTLTVNGSQFANGAVVFWNGSARATTFVSTVQLAAAIPSADLTAAGAATVTVGNPGSARSNAAIFEITAPVTSIGFTRTDRNGDQGFGATISEPAALAVGYDPTRGLPTLAVASSQCTPATGCLLKPAAIALLPGAYLYTDASPQSLAYRDVGGSGGIGLLAVGIMGSRTGGLADQNGISFTSVVSGGTTGPITDSSLPGSALLTSIAVGDFNGDGHLDIVLAGASQLYFAPGNGDGSFGTAIGFGVGGAGVAAGDFNRDGILDVAVTNEMGNTVSIYLGNGDGTFASPTSYGTGLFPGAIVAADLNGDGKLDLAILDSLDDTVSVLLGNGDGTFETNHEYPAGIQVANLTFGDYNGDGKLDLAVSDTRCSANACPASGSVNILIGQGDGSFLSPLAFAVGAQPNPVVSADLNGLAPVSQPDAGRAGFAATSYTDNIVSIYIPVAPSGSANPVPTISSISPTYAIQNSGAFTLTINGTNFVSGSAVTFGGQPEPTAFVSSTELTASIPASALSTVGPVNVVVTTPAPGGGNSISTIFNVYLPPPAISSITPSSAVVGSPGFALSINGANFVNDSQVSFNGTPRPVAFLSTTQLTATVAATDLANQGMVDVTVVNPFGTNDAGGGTSNSLALTVLPSNTQPTVGSLSPASATAGGPSFTLTIFGSGFSSNSAVTFGSKVVTSAYVNPTEIQATIPASSIAAAGTPLVTVSNPGGNPSLVVSFAVNADYTVSPVSTAAASATVSAGQSAGYSLSLVPSNGKTSATITFSATGLPAGASTSFVPSSIPPGSSTTIVQISIATTPHTSGLSAPWGVPPHSGLPLLLLSVFGITVALACSSMASRRGKPQIAWLIALGMVLLVTAGLAGCGNSSGSSNAQLNPTTGTPAGAYHVTVMAKEGTATVSTMVTLDVN